MTYKVKLLIKKIVEYKVRIITRIFFIAILFLGIVCTNDVLAATQIQGPVLGRISSYYGTRDDPFFGHKANHMGIDIAADAGTPVFAMQEGVVSFSGKKGGYGNCVMISHFFTNVPELPKVNTLYGHLSKYYVKEGDYVKRGQVIGLIGSTGRSTGPHLHFEVKYLGKNIDPIEYLKKLPSYLEYAAYIQKNKIYSNTAIHAIR